MNDDAIAMLLRFQRRQHLGEMGALALLAIVASAVGTYFLGRLMALFGPIVGLGVVAMAVYTYLQYREVKQTLEELRTHANEVRWIFPAKLDLLSKNTRNVVQTHESIEFHYGPSPDGRRKFQTSLRSGKAVSEFTSMVGPLKATFPNAELGWSPEKKAAYEALR